MLLGWALGFQKLPQLFKDHEYAFFWRKNPQHPLHPQRDPRRLLKLRTDTLVKSRASLIPGDWILNYSEPLKGLNKSNSENYRKIITIAALNTCF